VAAQAETAARSIIDPDRQEQTLIAVAGALARAGQPEQAETVTRSIADLDRQAQALVAASEALAVRGDKRQALHVASAACAVGRWTMVLRLVLLLKPSAIRVLTDL
jgi:hypothetical protein